MPRESHYFAAFKETFNTVGMASAVALSVALLNPVPMLAGVVIEVAYLLTVPDSKWYAARLSRRYDAEVEQRRQQLKTQVLATLRPEMKTRFGRLEEMRKQIDTQAEDNRAWYREVLRKLDYLLEKFLLFAGKEAQFRGYLSLLRDELHGDTERGSSPRGGFSEYSGSRGGRGRSDIARRQLRVAEPGSQESTSVDSDDAWVKQAVEEIQAHYSQEREKIAQSLQNGQDDDTRAILTKRDTVLQRRHEFAGKIGQILGNLSHQLQLVEDTFGLINDEIRARSPEQILADIDEVVVATDTMTTTLEELAPYEQMVARVGE